MTEARADKIREHWESATTVSLADHYLKDLEMSAIESFVPQDAEVLDIGCGDGEGTLGYARVARDVLGIDYSSQMIARAHERLAAATVSNVTFRREDLLAFEPEGRYDCVITERCLINLDGWQKQQMALRKIRDMLRPDGIYLMSEATTQGLSALNAYRQRVDLAPIEMPWHNRYFDLDVLLPELNRIGFQQRTHIDFGLYNFISRVVNPLASAPDQPRRDSPINRAGFELQRALGNIGFDGVGAISLLVLQRSDGADA